jgi:hypothetical protein
MTMNTPGIFGSHPEDIARAKELDRYLDSQAEWSDDDKRKAKAELYDDITWNGAAWDENLESYRLDMFVDWESVMCSRLPRWEKLAELTDIQDRYVKLYCDAAVEQDPDKYCEMYCGDDE